MMILSTFHWYPVRRTSNWIHMARCLWILNITMAAQTVIWKVMWWLPPLSLCLTSHSNNKSNNPTPKRKCSRILYP